MTSVFPAYPDHRMAYHLDGTQVYDYQYPNLVLKSFSDLQNMNNESSDYVGTNGYLLVFLFPQLRDITGILVAAGGNYDSTNIGTVYYSTNTTNGTDGTWTLALNPLNRLTSQSDNNFRFYARQVTTLSLSGVKAIKINTGAGIGALHLFGTYTPGQTPDRIDLWHPTSDVRVSASHFDFSDVLQSTTSDISFRVKNISATQTASSIAVSIETLSDLTPSVAGQMTLNLNGGSFSSLQTISSLSAGSISNTLTLRRTTAYNAALGPWSGYIKAIASSWS